MRPFSAQVKLSLINRAKSGEKVAKLCRETQISRKTFYQWLKKYNESKPNLAHIALCDKRFKKIISVKTVDPKDKLLIINKALYKEDPVSSICKNFKISRKSFYSWLKKYQTQGEAGLYEKRPKGETHYRFLAKETQELILYTVAQHPQFSVHTLAKALNLGHHGIQNLLERKGLSTHQRRKIFAEGYITTPKTKVSPLYEPQIPVYRLRQIIAPFITIPKLFLRNPRKGAIPLVFSSLPFFIFFFWIKLLISAPAGSSGIGLFFSTISLSFGVIFFLYSLKYYMSAAMVLKMANSGPSGSQKPRVTNKLGRFLHKFLDYLPFANANNKARTINPLLLNFEKITLDAKPFVSIHVAVYNEKNVIERLIRATTGQDWFVSANSSTPGESKPTPGVSLGGNPERSRRANYEVVIVDDSTDETTEIVKKFLKDNYGELRVSKENDGTEIYQTAPLINPNQPSFTLIHRVNRSGFKGGALQSALEVTDPAAEYVVVFDADFVPYPDTIEQFVKAFQVLRGNQGIAGGIKGNQGNDTLDKPSSTLINPDNPGSRIAAVQGYQWHVLNKSQTWVTRGVRTEYAGSYVIERSSVEIYGGLKQIAGSVYAIRADILREFGWGKSITEDFELTLRLYEAGYKVSFIPYIQAPAEAVSTIKRLIRQRMRWAEGASFNIKVMLSRMLFGHWESASSDNTGNLPIATLLNGSIVREQSQQQFNNETIKQSKERGVNNEKIWVPSQLTLTEKLEFIYLAPYYLQAAFFVVGTLSWFISEAIFHSPLPFWTSAFGWSLVFTNMLSLPLMNIIGLFLEESDERDYLGVFSFVALSYIVVPFQAYAAVKGFIEPSEGPWFRTPKTGLITDVFDRSRFSKFFGNLFGRAAVTPVDSLHADMQIHRGNFAFLAVNSPINQPHNRKRLPLLSRSILTLLIIITVSASFFSYLAPNTYATNRGADYGQWTDVYCPATGDCKISYYDVTNTDLRMSDCDNATCSSGGDRAVDETDSTGQYTSIYCLASDNCKIAYYDVTAADLNFVDCDNSVCDSRTITTVDSTGNVGQYTSIYCISDTDCKISYYDVTNTALKYVDCDNATCSTNTIRILDGATGCVLTGCSTTTDVGQWTGIYCPATDDCKISYFINDADGGLLFADCNDASCSTGARTSIDIKSNGATSVYCISSTDCKISYYDNIGGGDLSFVDCDDTDCVTNINTNGVDTGGAGQVDVGNYNSVFCPATDDCKISYYDTANGNLKFVDCGQTACNSTGRTITTVDGCTGCTNNGQDVGQYTGIYCPTTSDCKVSYYDVTDGDLTFLDCGDAECDAGNTITTVALTVPEYVAFLLPFAPFLPKIVKKLKAYKLWKPKKN